VPRARRTILQGRPWARWRAILRQRRRRHAGQEPSQKCLPDHRSLPILLFPSSVRAEPSKHSPDVLDLLAAAHLVCAPARTYAVGSANEDRFDTADLVVLDLEQLAQLPGPVDRTVVEEGEREHDSALAVHGDEAAVADAGHRADQRGLELLRAPLHFL